MKDETDDDWTGLITNILLGIIIMILSTICSKVKGQQWEDENRGLYPQSLQLNINARNTALGIRYGYLFQKPILSMPLGIYMTFSNTIHPNTKYINYSWERKYSIGGSVTMGNAFKNKGTHFMPTIGLVYNEHPKTNQDLYRPPGQFTAGYYNTTNVGCDIGIMAQRKHFVGHIKLDIINFMRYVEIGAGFSFYKLTK